MTAKIIWFVLGAFTSSVATLVLLCLFVDRNGRLR